MKSNKLNLPVILLILVLFIIFLFCKDGKNIVKQSEINFKKEGELSIFKNVADSLVINLDIEIADNDYEIQTGLKEI